MKEDKKFVRNIVISINDKSASFSLSKTVLRPTESFLAKIKNNNKIKKNSSQILTNVFGKLNQNNNEEFNFLDYKNYVSENLIKYLSDINSYKKQLKLINRTYFKYSKFRHIRRKLRPYYLSKMKSNNNLSFGADNQKRNSSIINLIDHKNRSSEQYDQYKQNKQYAKYKKNEKNERNEKYGFEGKDPKKMPVSEKINSAIHTINICHDPRNERRLLENSIINPTYFRTLQNPQKINNKSSADINQPNEKPFYSFSKRRSNLFCLPNIEYSYDYKINRKSKEKLNEINYCISKVEEKLLKNKSNPSFVQINNIFS